MNNPVGTAVVLELAPLPREQVGPFLLLGVEKTADTAAIEAHWAERLKLARRQLIDIPLQDINWARETLSDPEKRMQFDLSSFNLDSCAWMLRELCQRSSAAGAYGKPMDVEKDLSDYSTLGQIPSIEEMRATFVVPEIPQETKAPVEILKGFFSKPLDPWALPEATR